MTRFKQQGATLAITLILLVVATLLVVAGLHLSSSAVEVTTNAQRRMEAEAAAQQTVEAAVGSPLLTTSPTSVFTSPCNGQPNTLCADANGDGTDDVTATLTPTPTCVTAAPIRQPTLDVRQPNDQLCVIEQSQTFGVQGSGGPALCANTVWDVRAVASDAATGATVAVAQGIGVRVRTQDVATSCP